MDVKLTRAGRGLHLPIRRGGRIHSDGSGSIGMKCAIWVWRPGAKEALTNISSTSSLLFSNVDENKRTVSSVHLLYRVQITFDRNCSAGFNDLFI